MFTWGQFAEHTPELAAFGQTRFSSRVAYLATIRADGSPRLHPVTPIIGKGRMFLFMSERSPKGHDLQRDGRYALHCSVENDEGGGGEFVVRGQANFIEKSDTVTWALAAEVGYTPKPTYVLFEFLIVEAFATTYPDGEPTYQKWTAP